MVGAFPRKEGMERKDLLAKNIDIFKVSVVTNLGSMFL
jgi:malate/lactate dehydrogenase